MKNKFLIPLGFIWLVLLKAIFWLIVTHFNHAAYNQKLHFTWAKLYTLKDYFSWVSSSNIQILKWVLHGGYISILLLNMIFFFHLLGLKKETYFTFLKWYAALPVFSFLFILLGKFFDISFLKSNGYLILSFVEGPWIFIILLLSQQLLTYPTKKIKK